MLCVSGAFGQIFDTWAYRVARKKTIDMTRGKVDINIDVT
jgi:hypothetical protein